MVSRLGIVAAILLLPNLLGGCLVLSSAGPDSIAVDLGDSPSGVDYALVKVTPATVGILAKYGAQSISATFGEDKPPPEVRFGIGDVLSVTIFEAAAGGLFIPIEAGVRPGNFVSLPNQPIDIKGNITIPYAGAIKAAGRTAPEVEAQIVEAIKNRAIEPQAIVALVNQNTSLITVVGEVNGGGSSVSGRIPAMPAGERIVDYITRAGGLKDQGQDTWVVLERQGRRATVPFGSLIYEPGNNIWAWPGDRIYIYREPQTFLAFGAAGQQGQFPFSAWANLARRSGRHRRRNSSTSSRTRVSVYLYRREAREVAEKLGIDCSRFDGPTVPIVYSMSFKDPGGYFLATKMQMHNKDVIFAANAQSVQINKFLQLVNQMVAVGEGFSSTGVSVETWRVLSHTR